MERRTPPRHPDALRVGFTTQWYPPEQGVLIPRLMAHGLARRGHEVHVLTGFPNYPTGRLQEGYSLRPYRREDDGPVAVHRAPLYPYHGPAPVRRAANYLSFAAAAAAVGRTRMPRPDVWLTYGSPVTAAAPAAAARRRGVPHALVVQDLWPDSVFDSGMAGRAQRTISQPLARLSLAGYRSADALGVISPGMRAVLVDRGLSPDAIVDTPNWAQAAPEAAADRPARGELGLPERGTLFLYAGNLGALQDLGSLLRAFDQVDGGHLVLIGDGMCRDELVTAAAGRSDVTVLPPVPADQIHQYLSAADVLVVSLRDTPLLRVTMPSKMQSSLAAGRPVLVQGCGDVADVVARSGAGAHGPPGSAVLARAAQHLVDIGPARRAEMGRLARAWYDEHYSPDAGVTQLEQLLRRSIERHWRQ